jgi:catechol 2,3-dioxygenase-like lactoylglutathione lyase family enzyme
MLKRILGFTLAVEDVERSLSAWCDTFGWRISARGRVPAAAARAWDAHRVAGARYALLVAPTGEPAGVRLIEQPSPAGWRPRQHLGWAAVEIACQDPYALAASLTPRAGAPLAPWRVAVPPRPIPWDASIHAMQLVGVDGELLYLTQLPADRPMLDLVPARVHVDRAFIAVLACRDLDSSLRFYDATLGTPTLPPSSTVVQIVNDEFALGHDARTPLGVVKLPREFLLEVDQYPAAATPRPREDGRLPPGIAMLTVEADGPAAVVRGPDDEWLECVPPTGDRWADVLAFGAAGGA